MEVWIFAGLMGIWFSALFLIFGILIGRGIHDKGNNNVNTQNLDKRQLVLDSSNISNVWNRNSNWSNDQSTTSGLDEEERLNILQTLRVGASRKEKIVLDYYIDHIRSEIEMNRMRNKYKFYWDNEDFRIYVDKCAKTYNKTINEVLESPITEEYYLLLLEKEKATKDEN